MTPGLSTSTGATARTHTEFDTSATGALAPEPHLRRRPGRPHRHGHGHRQGRRQRLQDVQRPRRQRRARRSRCRPSNDLSVNEGSTHTYSYTITDPGTDTVDHVTTELRRQRHQGHRRRNTNAGGCFDCTFPDGDATSIVSARAPPTPTATPATPTRRPSTSHNVAPTVTLSAANDLSVNEGSTHTYSYTISDPGQDTVASVAVDCGANGTPGRDRDPQRHLGLVRLHVPRRPDSSTVSVNATDSDGDAGNTDTQDVTVNNVAPTVDPDRRSHA